MADDTKRRLWRYKSDIEERPDEEKLLQILAKLYGLPVTIALLQETGIGRMVNRYRNKDGLVGDKARAVVAKWKSVVEKEVHKAGTAARKSPSPSPTHSKEDEAEESDTNSWDSFNAQSRDGGSDSNRKHDQSEREDSNSDDSDMEQNSEVSRTETKVKQENKYLEVGDSHPLKYEPKRTGRHGPGRTTSSSGSESEAEYKPSRIPEAAMAMSDEEYRPDSKTDTEMYIPSKIKKEPASSEGSVSEEEDAYTPVMSVGGKRSLQEALPYTPTRKSTHSKYSANSSSEVERASDEDGEYVPSKKRKLHKKTAGMGYKAVSSRSGEGRGHSHANPRRDDEELTDSDAEDGYGESSFKTSEVDDYYHSLLSGVLDKDVIKQEKGSSDTLESRKLSEGGKAVGRDRDNRREERTDHLKHPHSSGVTGGSSRSRHSGKEKKDEHVELRKSATNHPERKRVDRKQRRHSLSESEDEASTSVDTHHLDSHKNASYSSSHHRHHDHSSLPSSDRSSSSSAKPSSLSASHGKNSSVKSDSARKGLKNHRLSSSQYDPAMKIKEEKIDDDKYGGMYGSERLSGDSNLKGVKIKMEKDTDADRGRTHSSSQTRIKEEKDAHRSHSRASHHCAGSQLDTPSPKGDKGPGLPSRRSDNGGETEKNYDLSDDETHEGYPTATSLHTKSSNFSKGHEGKSREPNQSNSGEKEHRDKASKSYSSSSSSQVSSSTAYHSSKERDMTKDSKRHSSSNSSKHKKDHISSSSSHAKNKDTHKSSSPSNSKDIIDTSKPSSSSKNKDTCTILKSSSSSSSKHRENHRSSSSSSSNHNHIDKSNLSVKVKHCENSTNSHSVSSDRHDRNYKSGLSSNSKHSEVHKPSSSSTSKHKEKFKSKEEGSEKNRDVSSSHHKSQKSASSKNHKKDKYKDTGENFETNFFSEPILIKPEPPSASPVNRSRNVESATKNKAASSPKLTSATASTLPNSSGIGRERLKDDTTMSRNHLFGSRSSGGSEVKEAQPLTDPTVEISERTLKPGEAKAGRTGSGKAKKRKEETKTVEIDESSMSFEDFMNIEDTVAKKKSPAAKYSNKPSQKSTSCTPHMRSATSSSNKESKSGAGSASTKPDSNALLVPEPSSRVEVTPMDILNSLPETQAHYRPLRFNPYLKDEEEHPEPLADSDSIGMKPNLVRTQVYSGRRTRITEVKPLFELCMQVLIENIDAIDYVGGIPYSILKPVLERCSAQQLYQLEDYNPHLLEDSEELWEELCQREFRGNERDELETWRELYLRKFEERQEKYQKLKASMSATIVKGQAGRKAKLAYVDTVAKPPREVLRKQKQFGTGCVVRTKGNQAIRGSCSGLKVYKPSTTVPARNPMNETRRDVRPTPAMMAKALQMRKNMRR